MNKQELTTLIHSKKSYLCIGLDPVMENLPSSIPRSLDGMLEFIRHIIECTQEYCIAYKPNTAFFEAWGKNGYELLEETYKSIPSSHFLIADAKRGDIGYTSQQYARSFYAPGMPYRIDGVTLNPYMGKDSIEPFLAYPEKWAILLALTSNVGAEDFQKLPLQNGRLLYEEVIAQASQWGRSDQVMFVAGATQPLALTAIRRLIPHHFLLIPGIGAQGGDLNAVSRTCLTHEGGLIVNASRSILYASGSDDFGEKAQKAAQEIQKEMATCLENFYAS